MGVDLSFRKAIAETYIDALVNRKPIPLPRTLGEYLTLAGACFYVVRCTGSDDWPRRTKDQLGTERWEAQEALRKLETRSAIEIFGLLVSKVYEKSYDEEFEPIVTMTIADEGEKVALFYHTGHKKPRQGEKDK